MKAVVASRPLPLLLALVLAPAEAAIPAGKPAPPAVRVEVRVGQERGGTLTTERALALAPEKSNPRWAAYRVEPRLEVGDVRAAGDRERGWTVASVSLRAVGRLWVRATGADPNSGPAPSPRAAYAACVERLADQEAEAWMKWVQGRAALLIESLRGLHAYTEEDVLSRARAVVGEKAPEIEQSWRMAKAREDGRAESCGGAPFPEERTDRLAREGEERNWAEVRPLARVPLRRWDRQVTARVQLWQGGKALNGQFLVDLAAPHSIVDPEWLEGQGIPPDWVRIPSRGEARIRTDVALEPGVEGPWIRVDGAELSGQRIPITEFQVAELDLYGQPDAVSACCDGVLGADLLKRFVVETRLDGMQELVLYDPVKYRVAPDWRSADLAWEEPRGWVSDCGIGVAEGSSSSWHWAEPFARAEGGGKADVSSRPPAVTRDVFCGGALFGTMPGAAPAARSRFGFQAIDGRRLVWDFPQGRLRFPPQPHAYPDPAPARNLTGLGVAYQFKGASRVVVIRSLAKGSLAARAMGALGASKGDLLVSLGGKGAEKLPSWEIADLLGGRGPKELEVKWRSRGSVKTAIMSLP